MSATRQPKVSSKQGNRIVDNGERKVKLSPLEDAFNLVSMLQIKLQGQSVGAYILRKGTNNYLIHFGFECRGIHPTLQSDQIDPVFDAIESGLKDLPSGERLTIHLSSFTDDTVRQKQLKELIKQSPNKELQ